MLKLFKKILLLLTPLLLIVGFFVIVDPMKIIHEYKDPLEVGVLMNDRHFQATYLLKNKIQYQSFIVGSSRSKMFQTHKWQKYIGADTSIFHMGVNDESLWGLMKKLEFLDSKGYKIKHCLFPMDHRLIRDIENNEAHIFRDHPAVSGETYLEYYKFFFIAFINPEFLTTYMKWIKTHKYDPSMKNFIWKEDFTYDRMTGDIFYKEYDDLLAKGEPAYYEAKKEIFYTRDSAKVTAAVKTLLNAKTTGYLKRIKQIFDKHGTEYKVIITPNYDQIAMSDSDCAIIKSIFGPQNVTNYSGINSITVDKHNYYEEKHFRPYIADSLMMLSYKAVKP